MLHRRCWLLLAGCILAGCILACPTHAQPADTIGVSSLLRGAHLGIGANLQADAAVNRSDDTDGFDIRVARLRMRGAVDAASFFLQSDFADDLAVVDVRMQVALSSRLTLRGGLYKTPFSQSVLTFRGHLPLLERPRMVDALAPQRQLGGHLAFDAVPRRLLVEGGLYNGNGDTLSPNDNNSFLYIGRVSGAESLAFATVQWGLNAGYSHDTNVEIPRTAAAFAGTRILFGGDVTLRTQRWRVLGEIIGAHLDATNGAERSPLGLAIVGGVTPAEHHEVVVRYDRYNPDAITPTPNDIWELGYTYTPNAFLKTRVHYAASDDSLGNGAWTVRLQMVVN